MAKQWKQSLEQSDILSDGTPFDGANIDAKVSDAGFDYSRTLKYTTGKVSIFSGGDTDVITVSGSGHILSLSGIVKDSDLPAEITLSLDSTDIFTERFVATSGNTGIPVEGTASTDFPFSMPVRKDFTSSLTVNVNDTGSSARVSVGVIYVLD